MRIPLTPVFEKKEALTPVAARDVSVIGNKHTPKAEVQSLDGDDVRVESRASANDIVEEAVIPARELLRVLKKYNSGRDRDLKARKTFWEFMHPRSSEAGASLEMPLKMRVGDFFAASAVTRLEFAFLISLWGLNADSLSEHVSTKDPEAAGKTEDTA